ncbi:SDR family NAD(P)-dependent oxidoreductase [Tenacibaculum jejuense]|uniref:Benzil reductase ((S)-benzoin forming) n=1 Tax=Tenacibaculum jejuense TaxID=584609 RepID=A0A238U8Z3_9FLAO|nr:SDR family NAD(P)-dependent oxidoreductase [Tenacibaculum jejuense]SNR15659.1 Benzil reductase ((S)-benzoin forming) [Tenacibaculum jejuense]
MNNVLIITGGSKGIGNAIVKKYSQENYKVYSLSRTIIDVQNVTQTPVDLLNIKEAKNALEMLIDEIKKSTITSITLINNAGRLGEIANLEHINYQDIHQSVFLNTTIPLIFSSLFINQLSELNCKKQIINISSGAAKKPYEGWSVYCSSKAALDMITATIAKEQENIEYGVKSFGIRPGVVDTNMQSQIRTTEVSNFKNVQRFIDLKNNNELYSPDYVAERIYNLDISNKLVNGQTIDLREV